MIARLSSLRPQLRELRCALHSGKRAITAACSESSCAGTAARECVPPILWLAARRQRIARFAALHADCAPSAHEKVAIDSTRKIVAVVKCIGWDKHRPHQLAIRRMCDDSPRDTLRNDHSPYLKLVHIFGDNISPIHDAESAPICSVELAEAVTRCALTRA